MSASPEYKKIPPLDELLKQAESLQQQYGRHSTAQALKAQLAVLRKQISTGTTLPDNRNALTSQIIEHTEHALHKQFEPSLKPVINLTGIILHTNLGRAPYPQAAIDAMVNVSRSACNLEFNLATGKRGRRDDHVEKWICELTGAEAATTVNNNAAAVLLTLNTLARKRDVIVSRGELIEIGGSFRMPAIMKKAQCKLREVGTTNRTHLKDYESAIGKRTGALMKVHTSNFEINGFSHSVSAAELSGLAQKHSLPLIDDMGSGNLIDLTAYELPAERTATEALNEGIDLITFSGDKLLGGPQCGIVAGKKSLIEAIEKNPLKRTMRLDKLTLAALEVVLKLYANPATLVEQIPALRLLTRTENQIQQTAIELKNYLDSHFKSVFNTEINPCESQIGSGALPTKTLASTAVTLHPVKGSVEQLAASLRELPAPVIGRIQNDAISLDVRALESVTDITEALQQLPR